MIFLLTLHSVAYWVHSKQKPLTLTKDVPMKYQALKDHLSTIATEDLRDVVDNPAEHSELLEIYNATPAQLKCN